MMSVDTPPEAITLQRKPDFAYWNAVLRVRPIKACFEAV
jgi:hypothetical protein